jgi:hypothetical protein
MPVRHFLQPKNKGTYIMKTIRGIFGFFRRQPITAPAKQDDLYAGTDHLGYEAAWPIATDHAPMP